MSIRRMFPHYQINVETSQTCFTTKCSNQSNILKFALIRILHQQLIHRIVQQIHGQGPFRGPRLAARNKMDTIFEKSLFHDQNDISNGNLIKKCFFKNFIVPVLQSIQNVDFVIKNSSFSCHFSSFSPFKIAFWLYIVKKRSYNKTDTIFEKSLFHDQN